MNAEAERADYPADVQVVEADGREFLLIGTAHISRESADLVRRVIDAEHPDCVAIELDRQRYDAIADRQRFESLDLIEVIRRQQLAPLLLNLVLVSYQQQLGGQLGVMPGTEFIAAAEVARERNIPVALCDREVRVTLRRAWGAIPLRRRFMLFASVLGSFVERPQLTEDDLRRLREQDVTTRLIEELGATFPGLKTVLIDERDAYLAEKIRRTDGQRVVAVIGAGHLAGVGRALREHPAVDLPALETVPPVSALWRWMGWGIPALIIAALLAIGWREGAAAARHSAVFWVLVTGLPSMLGALVALGHPATVLTAFLAAPITTLTPALGAGYVAAFAQAYFRPPRVYELRSVSSDFNSPRRWWRNRLLQVLLVFLLVSVGAAAGAMVGSAEIVTTLF